MDYKLLVAELLQKEIGETLTTEQIFNLLEKPKSADHGDIAFPTFALAKAFRKAPQQIATDLGTKITDPLIAKIDVVGPYLNFFLNKESVSSTVLKEVLDAGTTYGNQSIGLGQTIPIDLSSPNIAKPISMGHLRSTVIGNSIANIAEKLGFKPIRINHLGDWGTQFGKLIVAYKLWGNEESVKAEPINELLRLYVKFHAEAEEKPELDDEARAWFKRLEDGDEEAVALWKWFREESLTEFNHIYKLLGIEFDSYNGEAFYNDKMDEVLDLLEEKHILTVDNGATIVDLEKYNLNPALIRKSDGATLYITRDLAAALYRHRTYNFAQSLYVVGNEQSNHFKQLKAVLKELGFDWADQMHHVPFGLITQGGKKLSTRKGKIVLLEEVLNEAVNLANQQITEKNPDLADKDTTASQVGIGAVIFHDLKNDRLNNFDFVLEEVVRFEGETGPYVQYTRARAMSILRKAADVSFDSASLALDDEYSWEVIKLIQEYPTTVLRAYDKLEPSVIAKHAIHLAQAFNRYYAQVKVLNDDAQKPARLALVKAVTIILKEDLRLLGVGAPDEM
ncbi:MAG: arginine--tRNA ligase [Carnobacterium sp.]|jgi:arginyl-tRNA synthetase|uniref:Arginine--tRNA ligase n=3 Tax=Bacillota TaxID=1239 RepID=K8E2Y0_CARML|nr:arginine--tRNA ligase [Carnobacterium maltaromaticum]AOA01544.1 arginine--tRNA ligase [Carnobacterium maltaromaticum]KRN60688.1 arginine--tRNA ligase [Carnobacterium maltaromaticum DSM 20342]KRN71604.1 arginine--tRNA ligase [Carnobacterium maltaromaticum]KRN84301.1 arginine--tRNA ligase [Carnobacterium maltaromaticum]MBC9787033.1 arginine--tRNA ligase [Carnobacterium maltaromaticum]